MGPVGFDWGGHNGGMSLLVPRGLRAWLRTSLLVTLLTGFALLASPASAHTTLVDAGPNSGDEIAPGAELVALKFGEEVDSSGTLEVAVLDADEEPVPVSDAQISSADGSTVCTRTAALKTGVHTVRYEITAADGHVVRGNYQFTVADGAAEADDLGCDVSALPEPTEEKSLDDLDQGDFPAWAIWVIGAVVVVTAGLAVVAVLRSRRDQEDDDESPTKE